jgi:hypothetical protein
MTKRVACCSCRQLQIRCTAEPAKVSLCHCLECQRRTGSPFGVAAFFEASSTEVIETSRSYQRGTDADFQSRSPSAERVSPRSFGIHLESLQPLRSLSVASPIRCSPVPRKPCTANTATAGFLHPLKDNRGHLCHVGNRSVHQFRSRRRRGTFR